MTAGFLVRFRAAVFFHKFLRVILTPGIFMADPTTSDAFYFTALVLVRLEIILCFRRRIHGMGAAVAGCAIQVTMAGGIPVQGGIGCNPGYSAMARGAPRLTHPRDPA